MEETLNWYSIVIVLLAFLSILWTIFAAVLRFTWKPGSWGLSYDRIVMHVQIAQVLWAVTGTAVFICMVLE